MQIFNFRYFQLKFCKQHQNRIQKKSGVRIFEILIILASAGRQSSVNLLKTAKNAVFHVSDPKNKTKNQNQQNSYITFFLNHTKMTLTNFQWISTKKKICIHFSLKFQIAIFLRKWSILAQNRENFHENIAFSLILA